MKISDAAKKRIDQWIQQTNRNQFGDPKSTAYAGGNPLFSERSAVLLDRYEYILGRHPELVDLLRKELGDDAVS